MTKFKKFLTEDVHDDAASITIDSRFGVRINVREISHFHIELDSDIKDQFFKHAISLKEKGDEIFAKSDKFAKSLEKDLLKEVKAIREIFIVLMESKSLLYTKKIEEYQKTLMK